MVAVTYEQHLAKIAAQAHRLAAAVDRENAKLEALIRAAAKDGMSFRQIEPASGMSRETVRQIVNGTR